MVSRVNEPPSPQIKGGEGEIERRISAATSSNPIAPSRPSTTPAVAFPPEELLRSRNPKISYNNISSS